MIFQSEVLSESEDISNNALGAKYFGILKAHHIFGKEIEGCRENTVA